MEEETKCKARLGTVLAAAGAVIAATSVTPVFAFTSNQSNDLNLIGNAFQAGGNGLVADTEREMGLRAADLLKAAGNIVIIDGILDDSAVRKQKKLFILGNWLQAEGGFLAAASQLAESDPIFRAYQVSGNLLQGIGNSLQAIGIQENLSNLPHQPAPTLVYSYSLYLSPAPHTSSQTISHGTQLVIKGAWIQAIGSILTAIALFLPEEESTS